MTPLGSRTRTTEICDEFDVRTPNIEVAAHALSGGNQQKLLVGKELLSDPTVLIASHPTRGIDVGAQAAIWGQIKSARSDGLATLLIIPFQCTLAVRSVDSYSIIVA